MNSHQKSFGNNWRFHKNKVRALITNPEGNVTLTDFDSLPNRMEILSKLEPGASITSRNLLKRVKEVFAKHGEVPADEAFWDYWIRCRAFRNPTMKGEFKVINRLLMLANYYSKTFDQCFANYRLHLKDGVRRGDVILSEQEVSLVLNKLYPLTTKENIEKQRALDMFVLSMLTAARVSDIRTIIRSTDGRGEQVLLFHNRKGTRTQTIQYVESMDGIFERQLYNKMPSSRDGGKGIWYQSLRKAMHETLPLESNRLIRYYFLNPGRGRVLKADGRINHITFHTARHTFCTRLLRIGIAVQIVAQLAGHRSIQTTLRYYAWMTEEDANDTLKDAYKNGSLPGKTRWGQEPSPNKLTPAIHEKMLHKPQAGEPVAETFEIKALKDKLPNTKRARRIVENARKMGLV